MEDAVRTPFGHMTIDTEFRTLLQKDTGAAEDRFHDNTIEVLLPMVHFYFPKASLIWLRLPADKGSFKIGETILA